MIRQDFIQRAIDDLAAAFARLLGLTKSEEPSVVEGQLGQLYTEHLGIDREALLSLSPEWAARSLGQRVKLATALLEQEAKLREAQGRHEEAGALRAAGAALKGGQP
jgi:hypothetical protein